MTEITDRQLPNSQPNIPQRIVPRRRSEHIRRTGLRTRWHHDLYHRTLSLRWWQFMLIGGAAYLLVNVIFAALYRLQPGSIVGGQNGSFAEAFFFSVQTIATIGYGTMSPGTLYANILVTFETMTGLVFLALATGITFARISRPTARVMFTRAAVIGPHNGTPTLHLRIGNERMSQILEADVAVTLLRYETTAEGTSLRRFYDLPLLRAHTPIFALTFTIMHSIDAASPLFAATSESLRAEGAELLITVTGLEEITSQTVHARYSYGAGEIRFAHRFVDIFQTNPDGTRFIDYARFHDTEPSVTPRETPAAPP